MQAILEFLGGLFNTFLNWSPAGQIFFVILLFAFFLFVGLDIASKWFERGKICLKVDFRRGSEYLGRVKIWLPTDEALETMDWAMLKAKLIERASLSKEVYKLCISQLPEVEMEGDVVVGKRPRFFYTVVWPQVTMESYRGIV